MVALALTVPSASASTHTPPWSHSFGSHWLDLDTTAAAANSITYLSSIGYHAYKALNTTAVIAMGTSGAQGDAVWADFGHGAANGSGGFAIVRVDAATGAATVFARG